MAEFCIRKGKDIKLKGAAARELRAADAPSQIAITPDDFKGLKLRPVVKPGDEVKIGTAVLADKYHPDVRVVSPVSGSVTAVNRGDKRALLDIVIASDQKNSKESFPSFSEHQIKNLSAEDIKKHLMQGGLWTVIRQRPFTKIADPAASAKAVFIHAMSTEPLAADVDFVLQGREKEFQAGLDALSKLSPKTYLCIGARAASKALTQAKNVEVHRFSGAHPAGNVGTHIHCIDPINKGEAVWFVEAQDVTRIGKLFLEGVYSGERIVAVTGEGARDRAYFKTMVGAPVKDLLKGSDLKGRRVISGSVLCGRAVGENGHLRWFDSQITVILEGGKRELLGWLWPGFNKYSLSRTYASSLTGLTNQEVSLNTDRNGSPRAIVLNHLYDDLITLDVPTYFLIKAIHIGNIEECERLGIYECDEEDFALCSFACPSKTDVGGIIRNGLDMVEREM